MLAMMATATGCLGVGLWSAPVGGQTPPACSGPACMGYDWGSGPPGGTGGVPSSTTYMASHRMQRHSVITSDGAIHIIVNTGTPGSYITGGSPGTLQLYSSPDNGVHWYNTFTFPGTQTFLPSPSGNNTVSTDDVALRRISRVTSFWT